MSTMIGYSDIDSPIHKLTGASKLIALIIWAVASMITYDTRVLLGMFVISIIVFKISKVKFKPNKSEIVDFCDKKVQIAVKVESRQNEF